MAVSTDPSRAADLRTQKVSGSPLPNGQEAPPTGGAEGGEVGGGEGAVAVGEGEGVGSDGEDDPTPQDNETTMATADPPVRPGSSTRILGPPSRLGETLSVARGAATGKANQGTS